MKVEVGGKEYGVARVVLPGERASAPDRHDIALLQLAAPVPEAIAPLPLFDEDVEPGTEFVLAGYGVLAQGDAGLELTPEVMSSPTRKLRAGRNTVTRFVMDKMQFFATFDGPEKGLELEAGPCLGGSGGRRVRRGVRDDLRRRLRRLDSGDDRGVAD